MRRKISYAMCALLLACAALFLLRGGGALRKAAFRLPAEPCGLPPLYTETPRLVAQTPEEARLDLNAATEEELSRLPGVGAALSRRIVEYRERYGPFSSTDELDAVDGVGPALRFALQELVTVDE
ncbi:MAG: ComEA family DNA-binding protein [Clostridia bacterium]|nr:ComEA family DNA-binding protein [Clostridia bacterium]